MHQMKTFSLLSLLAVSAFSLQAATVDFTYDGSRGTMVTDAGVGSITFDGGYNFVNLPQISDFSFVVNTYAFGATGTDTFTLADLSFAHLQTQDGNVTDFELTVRNPLGEEFTSVCDNYPGSITGCMPFFLVAVSPVADGPVTATLLPSPEPSTALLALLGALLVATTLIPRQKRKSGAQSR